MSETPKQHLEATEVAPHGWERPTESTCPAGTRVYWNGHWYVPAKPKPRTWTGTMKSLGWGDDVVVTVTEVLPEE